MSSNNMNFATGPALTFSNTGSSGADITSAGRYSSLLVIISGLTSETVGVQVSPNGGTHWTGSVRPVDLATGTVAGASALGNGSYLLNLPPCDALRFVKSASAETVTIRTALR